MPQPLILFIIDGLAGGGAEKTVISLASKLAELDAEVCIISLRDVQAYPVPENVRLIKVADNYHGPFSRQTEIRRRAKQLDEKLQQHFPSRIINLAISNLPKTDRIVAASKILSSAWMCLHGAIASTQLQEKNGLRRWIKTRQLRNTYNKRKLITVSNGLQNDITEIGHVKPEIMITIPNPFDFDKIRSASKQPCPLHGEQYIIHVGRFHPVKRHDRLLEAFKLSNYPGKLVLLGCGTEQETLLLKKICTQLDIEDRVLFFGFKKNPYPYIRHAEALVLSSDFEGFGNVIIESLICETPVISTDCPYGPRDILTGNFRRHLAPLNAKGLAKTIVSVLENPEIVSDDFLRKFDITYIAKKYLELANPK
ncbi:glycosyltransferase [Aquitalea sp. S1-19]|nr:glycosyltransferase [Aquitalea sp. S1-19]